jgi:hypothetical protein
VQLTYAQMEGYAVKAGWPAALAPVVAAIGEAESGGNTDAVNPDDNNGTQSSYGWLQISNGTHTPPAANWADPAENAALGYAKWKAAGQSFSPWGTYDSGAYKAYVNGATTPDLNVSGNPAALTAETAAATDIDCWLGFAGVSGTSWLEDLFGSGGNVGKFCLISKSEGRGVVGALLMTAGVAGFALSLGLMLYLAGQRTELGAAGAGFVRRRAGDRIAADDQDQRAAAAQARGAQKAASAPRGRHASAGPNAPAGGRHARRGP